MFNAPAHGTLSLRSLKCKYHCPFICKDFSGHLKRISIPWALTVFSSLVLFFSSFCSTNAFTSSHINFGVRKIAAFRFGMSSTNDRKKKRVCVRNQHEEPEHKEYDEELPLISNRYACMVCWARRHGNYRWVISNTPDRTASKCISVFHYHFQLELRTD